MFTSRLFGEIAIVWYGSNLHKLCSRMFQLYERSEDTAASPCRNEPELLHFQYLSIYNRYGF